MSSMYEIIMDLPLFKGISHERLSELIETTKFHFMKFNEGEMIVKAGEVCDCIRFVVSGAVRCEIASANRKISLSEVLQAPNVIGPDYLFGMETCYPFTVYASGDCGIMIIDKADYINILQTDKLFLFNILNLLSRNAQKPTQGIVAMSTGSVAERLAFFVISLTQRGGRDITLSFKQRDLCTLLGVQRTSFVNALTRIAEAGVVEFSSGEIRILDRDLLLHILKSPDE